MSQSIDLETPATDVGEIALADSGRRASAVNLLSSLTMRGVQLRNRIAVSPMCQYSASEGLANDWHLVHLGSRAVGGAGVVMGEGSAGTPVGRTSPGDMG